MSSDKDFPGDGATASKGDGGTPQWRPASSKEQAGVLVAFGQPNQLLNAA